MMFNNLDAITALILSNLSVSLLFKVILGLLTSFVFLWLIYFLLGTCFTLKLNRLPQTILKLKPLRVTEQNPYATEQLFSLIHNLARQVAWPYRLLGVYKSYSLEIVSTKPEGIYYVLRINSFDEELIKKNLISYLPGLTITKIDDYLPENLNNLSFRITEYGLENHFAFALKNQEPLEKHDPMAYMTGNMTKLLDGELIAFQMVTTPVNKDRVADIERISKLIYHQADLLENINHKKIKQSMLGFFYLLMSLLLRVLLLPMGILVFIASDGREGPFLGWSANKTQERATNPYGQELKIQVKQKLDLPLFRVSMRLLVVGSDKELIMQKSKGFSSSLASFNNSSYQSIKVINNYRFALVNKLKKWLFVNRIIKPLNKMILSTAEMGDIYHLPFTKTTKTEDLVKSFSRDLPAPISLKNNKLEVVFGNNYYGESVTPIGLTAEERRRHMYILGATGTGKSTMLLTMIKQDIENGKGVGVIDPHGDLAEEVLQIIPKDRISDVVYFNPDDISHPVGINLLEITAGLSSEESIREKELIAESIISLFHKIYADRYSGPRMEYILRNAIHTAFIVPGATLFTVYKLLINSRYRNLVIKKLKDENLIDFWKHEFDRAGDYQKVRMIGPITNKIGRFLFSPTAKRILEQEKSTVDFDRVINEGKILICNLSKGKIGEDNSELFGVLMMAKIQLASLKRSRIPMKDRRDFYLYIDEFQNFATPAFAQILSEARKYRLNAILAHQTTSQLDSDSLVNVTLANTGTVVCFRTANPQDEKMILPQFQPYIQKGEIGSLPAFKFYIRLAAMEPQEPFSGKTILTETNKDADRTLQIIEASRKNYAISYRKNKEDGIVEISLKLNKNKQNAPDNMFDF